MLTVTLKDFIPLLGILFAGGIGAFLAYIVAPASERLAFKRRDRDEIITRLTKVESEVAELRLSNRFLTAGVTALQWHSDELRRMVIKNDPSVNIPTAAQILQDVRANLDVLDGEGKE